MFPIDHCMRDRGDPEGRAQTLTAALTAQQQV